MERKGVDPIPLTTRYDVDEWFKDPEHKYPSPTGFCLDFSIDPTQVGVLAKEYDWVWYGMMRLIAKAESQLTFKVYGPTAFIKRVEFLLGQTSDDGQGLGNPADEDGLFESVG